MSTQRKHVATFRLRGFTCTKCHLVHEVFGNDKPPRICEHCLTELSEKPDYDQVNKVTKIVCGYDE